MADGTPMDRLAALEESARQVDHRITRAFQRVGQVDRRLDDLGRATCAGEIAQPHGTPPSDLDAEALVLGALLAGVPAPLAARTPRERREARRLAEAAPVDAWPIVARWLDPWDFYSEPNGLIFEAVLDVGCEGAPRGRRARLRSVTLLDVVGELRRGQRLAQVGGPGYLAMLAASPHVPDLAGVCRRLAELAGTRRALARIQVAMARAYVGEIGLEALTRGLAADLERELVTVRSRGGAVVEDALGRTR